VLLADDHALIVGAFERLLADECDIVGTVTNGRELVEAAGSLRPDVIVADVSMPLLNGLDAARQIKQRDPDVRVIFLTMNEDAGLAGDAFRAGASGYLLKRSAVSELGAAIREVMQGRSYITPLIAGGLIDSLLDRNLQDDSAALTPRQREILQLLAEGRSMKEIAAVLDIAPRTVAFHKYRMMEQLQVTSTAELIRYALEHHIV
jgi:DNA-binding NarL/FixJ family response regulator